MSDVRLFLTCGLPGAGKTTLARQWLRNFEAPDAGELALFDPPTDAH